MKTITHSLVLFLILSLHNTAAYASNPKLLFNGNCIVCHKIETAKTAPSILEIKQNYIKAYPLKKDFINQMSV